MEWTELVGLPVPWVAAGNPRSADAEGFPFVVSTRFQAFRNFADAPFPISASPQALSALAEKALDRFAREGREGAWRLAACDPAALRIFRERHLLPEPPLPLPGKRGCKYLVLCAEPGTWMWLNEGEHVTRLQVFPGRIAEKDFPDVYRPPGEDGESHAPWAWSPRHGYLASDPSRIGPGFSVEMVAHLPALTLGRKLPQVHNAMAAQSVGFIPVTQVAAGETDSALFRLVSRGELGRNPREAYEDFLAVVQPLWKWEGETQRRYLEKQPKRLEDRVLQSWRQLSDSQALAYPEMLALGSFARWGAYLGLLGPRIPGILEDLRITTRSGHLQVSAARILSKEEEDIRRANVVRLSLETQGAGT